MKTKTSRQIDINELCHFTEKQKEASKLAKDHKFLLYGGAMGGGKSYFLRWKLVRMLLAFHARGLKNVTVGLFCEDYPSLGDRHLSKIKFEFPEWLGDYSSVDRSFTLKKRFGGGIIAFRNLDDASKYQSSEFAVIAVDELTKNTEETFTFLRTRLRWPGISNPKFIGASNPGGIGHGWVKKLWIYKSFNPNEQEKNQFVYIRARATDNPHIDPSYLLTLQSLPERQRMAYLDGNWDIFEGQYFMEWDRDKHVVKPFPIPPGWTRFRSIDPSGRHGITSCHWYALDYDGNVWVYREHYASGMDADMHAQTIASLSEGEFYQYTIIDTAAWFDQGLGETTAEVYARNNVYANMPSSKNRLVGWDTVHRYLRWDEHTPPKLRIFDTCVNLIRTLPTLIHDETNHQDIDTAGEDHAADELRYFLQTLRDQKTNPPMTKVEKRLEWLKKRKSGNSYNFGDWF